MLRNRNVRLTALALLALYLAATAAMYCAVSPQASVIMALVGCVSFAALLLLERRRCRELAKLANYLRSVHGGDYALDLPNHEEGEASILRSEIYKIAVKLREQNEALEREKKQLTTALSDISHQLKTPLTSLSVMTDLLCEGNLPEERRVEFTQRTRSQLTRLEWLVSALLKLSKLEAGTIPFHMVWEDAQALMDKACEPLRIPAELAGVSLVTEGEGTLSCDLNWTAEALLNILKNCIEHTPAGGEIRVRFTGKPMLARIAVEDTGAGIDPQDLPHVFERFYRGKNSAPDSVGIGLAMAQAIVTAQGGTITACNRTDSHGAAFYLTFYNNSRQTE